jgi:hypothetical protein
MKAGPSVFWLKKVKNTEGPLFICIDKLPMLIIKIED